MIDQWLANDVVKVCRLYGRILRLKLVYGKEILIVKLFFPHVRAKIALNRKFLEELDGMMFCSWMF